MDAPTATEIQDWTKLTDLKAAPIDEAERTTSRAISSFKRFTGLDFATVSADDAPEIQRAVQGLAELLTVQDSADYLETLADWDLLLSFSAGSYSETRRSAEDAYKARMLVAWPWLNSLLWGLMTPEKYDQWIIFFGAPAPAWGTQEVEWGAGQLPYVVNPWDIKDAPFFPGDL